MRINKLCKARLCGGIFTLLWAFSFHNVLYVFIILHNIIAISSHGAVLSLVCLSLWYQNLLAMQIMPLLSSIRMILENCCRMIYDGRDYRTYKNQHINFANSPLDHVQKLGRRVKNIKLEEMKMWKMSAWKLLKILERVLELKF